MRFSLAKGYGAKPAMPNWYSLAVAHLTVASEAQHEEAIENSRFLGLVWPVSTPEEALNLLGAVRAAHPEASHHCWAYRVDHQQRFSDDGEPGGTAGRPMLEVILKRNLNMVATVVVRYYGGKKLGAGGLVRAYSGTVSKALDRAGVREVVDMAQLLVSAPFSQVDVVLRTMDEIVAQHNDATKGEPAFTAEGLSLPVALPKALVEGAKTRLTEATHGGAQVTELDDER